MDSQALRPRTLEEGLVYWAIVGTWGLWLLGSLYLAGPLLGYGLLLIVIGRYVGILDTGPALPSHVPFSILLWWAGMLTMLVTLVVAHLDFELGTVQLVKSAIGWAKGWALLAVFPFVGAMLSIRPVILYRATGILALQTLMLVPVFMGVGLAGGPDVLYVSPLSLLGGPGSEFFDVSLYSIDNTSGALRWRFFAPWSTAAACIATVGVIFALSEQSQYWKIIGVVSAIVVCWMSGSRLAVISIPIIIGSVIALPFALRPRVLLAFAIAVTGVVLMIDLLLPFIEDMQEKFTAARAASSDVRGRLNAIAFHRWYSEAFLFGHGTVEKGPKLVQLMQIGSHHTWYGLLFVKGIVGLLALAIPLGWSLMELTLKAFADRVARAGFSIVMAIVLFSFADNLEIVAYLIWPALLLVGICLQRRFKSAYVGRLGGPAPLIRGDIEVRPQPVPA